MTTPIRLSSPGGTVYAYACGHCHNLGGSSEHYEGAEGVADHAEWSRKDAAACCCCHRCGAEPKPNASASWS